MAQFAVQDGRVAQGASFATWVLSHSFFRQGFVCNLDNEMPGKGRIMHRVGNGPVGITGVNVESGPNLLCIAHRQDTALPVPPKTMNSPELVYVSGQNVYEEGGLEALKEKSTRKPKHKNRAPKEVEAAVFATHSKTRPPVKKRQATNCVSKAFLSHRQVQDAFGFATPFQDRKA